MIVGLFLSNYKCYENAHFLNFSKYEPSHLNIFIGDNGSGKSSILEALNCILNGVETKKWETTLGKKNDRTAIFPVFLIKKSSFDHSSKYKSQYESISNIFWSYDFSKIQNNETSKLFMSLRDSLKERIDVSEYYLFSIGKTKSNHILMTTLFDKKIRDLGRKDSVSRDVVLQLYKDVLSHYSYVYFPVESLASDLLSLQAKELQSLMDKSVVDEIKQVLDKKDLKLTPVTGGRGKNESVIGIINGKLEEYIQKINDSLNEEYLFTAKDSHKKTIKSSDVIDIVISEFFNIRELTKDQKKLKSLSSGQQRVALIDVATKLLSTKEDKAKEAILAIDEPESSLDSQYRFEQFALLMDLAEKFNRNVFITTHWYGLLLRPSVGYLHFIGANESNDVTYDSYPLTNLYDYRKHFPDSLEMKSYFDFMSSVLSIVKKKDVKWIICEGYEDALYLKSYIKDENVVILPFNGNGNVKKIFDFLSVPFSDNQERSSIKGKVYCLIDTDTSNLIRIDGYSESKYSRKLIFDRLGYRAKTGEIILNSVASTDANKVTIEDCLNPIVFYHALKELASSNEVIDKYLDAVDFNEEATYTLLNHGMPFLNKRDLYAFHNEKAFLEELSKKEVKYALAKHYNQTLEMIPYPQPEWIDALVKKLYV